MIFSFNLARYLCLTKYFWLVCSIEFVLIRSIPNCLPWHVFDSFYSKLFTVACVWFVLFPIVYRGMCLIRSIPNCLPWHVFDSFYSKLFTVACVWFVLFQIVYRGMCLIRSIPNCLPWHVFDSFYSKLFSVACVYRVWTLCSLLI